MIAESVEQQYPLRSDLARAAKALEALAVRARATDANIGFPGRAHFVEGQLAKLPTSRRFAALSGFEEAIASSRPRKHLVDAADAPTSQFRH